MRTIFDDLDSKRFVPVKLKKAENYRLVYVNYNLAIQLGYSPDHLTDTLSNKFALIVDDEAKNSNSAIYSFADTYNSSPLKPTRESGSGRGVFLEDGSFLKGVGLTPLAPLKGTSMKTLNTGFCPLYEGIKEAIYGEFFYHHAVPSTQVLAIFDLGFKDDDRKNYTGVLEQGLIVRVGDHTRIGHYTDGTSFKEFEFNVGKHRPSDDWNNYKNRFAFSEIIKNHAKTLAYAEFNRFWHGAMDDGNTVMRGGLIDFGSAMFQLDTAPRYWLDPKDFAWFSKESRETIAKVGTFGYEYLGVADNLKLLYPDFNIQEFHLELKHQRLLKLLEMFGFLEQEAEDFLTQPEHEELLQSFYTTWWQLGKYFYWGNMNGRTSVTEPLSLIDIFSYLRNATNCFYEQERMPDIEVTKPMHVKKSNLEFWQNSQWNAPYVPYGVRLNGHNQMSFFSDKEKNEFYQQKDSINAKITAVFGAFVSYWQLKEENIAEKMCLLKKSVALRSMPITVLSRGPLLESFKKALTMYNAGQQNALQQFIDQTVAVTVDVKEEHKYDHAVVKNSEFFKKNSLTHFFQGKKRKKSHESINVGELTEDTVKLTQRKFS